MISSVPRFGATALLASALLSGARPLGIAFGLIFGSIAAASGQTTHKNCYEQIGCPHGRYFQKRSDRSAASCYATCATSP
jgi:hypothetical protein